MDRFPDSPPTSHRRSGPRLGLAIALLSIGEVAMVGILTVLTGISVLVLLGVGVAFASVIVVPFACVHVFGAARRRAAWPHVGDGVATKRASGPTYKLDKARSAPPLVTICAYCKSARDDADAWVSVETLMRDRFGVEFSHAICPECSERMLAEAGLDVGSQRENALASNSQ